MKQVILTFDDRVASQLEAVALLKEYGFGATFYINRFEEKRPEAEERPLMTAAELRQLAGAGFELGNHSVNHPDFSTLDDAEIEREIDGMERMFAAAGQEGKVIVLIYHGIPDAALHCSTAFAEFKMQMKYLKEEHYRVTGLAEFLRR